MGKLSEVKVGDKIRMELIVLEASERTTRTNKPYVTLKVSDGVTQLTGNYWDWPEGTEIPRRGAVYTVCASVGDWQGTPQLNVVSLVDAPDADINAFIPSSGVDLEQVFENAVSFVTAEIYDSFLRKLTVGILNDLKHSWLNVPGARTIHHAYRGGTLIHSFQVAKIAKSIAGVIPTANEDLAITGALLHDLGKLYTYGFDGAAIDFTDEGQLYEHAFIGAEFVGNYAEGNELITDANDERKLALLRHIILSHHGTLDFGAVVTPRCIEAYIVHHADALDAATEQLVSADKASQRAAWTDKIWALNNVPHLKPSYIYEIFAGKVSEE